MTKGTKIKVVIGSLCLLLILAMVYRYNPYRFSFLGHYDKIWAHRVNDTAKLASALDHFEGVELDLVFLEDNGVLDVNHPPAPSNGLTFEVYLSRIETGKYPYLWLDIKNLNSENSKVIFDRLQALFKNKSYPLHKVLVETRYPDALPVFTEAGYKTSYYLPSNPSEHIPKIDSILRFQPTIGISTTYKNYTTVAKIFPKKTKYIWILNHNKLIEHRLVRSILKDTTVKVVLVPYRPI